jgi:hypothetical protein
LRLFPRPERFATQHADERVGRSTQQGGCDVVEVRFAGDAANDTGLRLEAVQSGDGESLRWVAVHDEEHRPDGGVPAGPCG